LEQEHASLLQRERDARAEAEVAAAQLRAVLDAMPNGVSIVDVAGKAILFNDAVRQIWGSPLFIFERLEDYGEYRAWWPETGKRVQAKEWGISRALLFGETVSDEEVDIETFEGQRKTILNSSAPVRDAVGAPIGGVTVSVDITQRKRLERAAIEWAAQLDATFESLTDGALLYDASGQLLRMNDAARVIFALDAAPDYSALPPGERIARLQVRDAQDRPLAPEEWGLRGLARGERLSEPVELRITALDGSAKDLAITGGPVRAADGAIIGAVSLLRDVTQRRQIERAAAEQSAQLRATFDALAEPLCVFDAQGRILRQNKAEIAIFGFDQLPATIEERSARIDLRDPQRQRLPPEQLPSRRVLAGATLVEIDAIELVARAADGHDH
jgi:PAS domain S-box-containing protein